MEDIKWISKTIDRDYTSEERSYKVCYLNKDNKKDYINFDYHEDLNKNKNKFITHINNHHIINIYYFENKQAKEMVFFKTDEKTIHHICYVINKNKHKTEFFKEDGETINHTEYYANGKIEKIEKFGLFGEFIDNIKYYIDGKIKKIEKFRELSKTIDNIKYHINEKINRVEFFKIDGKIKFTMHFFKEGRSKTEFFKDDEEAIDHIRYEINNKLNYIEINNLNSKKLVKYDVKEQNLPTEIGLSFVNYEIERKKDGSIKTNKLKEKIKNTKCSKHKIISFSIKREGQNGHGICIAIQNEGGNKTFAIIDSNGYKKNHFTYSELTIEKYKEILGVEENDSLIYLKNSIQKGRTCVINTVDNIRTVDNLMKKGYFLKDIVANYNNLTEKKPKDPILAINGNLKEMSNSIVISESLGKTLMTGVEYNFMKHEKENSFFRKREVLRELKGKSKNKLTSKTL